jgi:two-component system sensor histidine kinase PhcS
MPLHHQVSRRFLVKSSRPGGLSEFAWKLMQAEERQVTLKNLRLISVLAAIMVPAFAVLDYFAYPERLGLFISFRVMCTISILGLIGVIESRYGKRLFRALTVALPLIPAFFISLMILYSGDPGTPYYAGLTLCIVAIGFLFHWTYREAFIVSASVLAMYLVACSPALINGMDSRTAAGFVNNCIFLLAKGVVVVFGSHVHYGFRVEEFAVRQRLRQEKNKLRKQREELVRTLRELRETEGQLIQSEKMASLGQLSAGMIHEIGNPLNYENQALFLLRKLVGKPGQEESVQEAIDDIQDSIDRMRDIVGELRDFSHKSNEDRTEFPVKESIAAALRMLRREIDESGTIVTAEVEPSLTAIGVKNQITQVLINLVQNAIHAVATANREVSRIRIEAREVDQVIEISIWDNGLGIATERVNNVFDPFYTTKELGQGTGLGLSICYRIVEAHQGSLNVTSEEGAFTQFTIILPGLGNDSALPLTTTVSQSPESHETAVS